MSGIGIGEDLKSVQGVEAPNSIVAVAGGILIDVAGVVAKIAVETFTVIDD